MSRARDAARRVRDTLRAFTLVPRGIAMHLAGMPAAGEVRVCYGHRHIPSRTETAIGGIVKLQHLNELFPNEHRRFNILYLVSSRLPDLAVGLASLARSKGARVVLNQNGVAYPGWFGPGWERVNAPNARLLHAADHVLYQSDFCRRAGDEFLGTRHGPSEILYNAIDTNVFTPSATPLPPRPLVLLLAGTQDVFYPVESALRAVQRLALDGVDVRLLVAGRLKWTADQDECGRAARRLVEELAITDRVEFFGPYAQTEAPSLYRRAHMLVHTTYNDPCPSAILEALASGLPVVYSDSGGLPELVGPEAGIGIPVQHTWERDVPADPGAVAAAVVRVAERIGDHATAARARAVARFDVEPWIRRHVELFERLVR
jgi:glycosyltransferase involved in cell wall biosynthesis